MTKLGNFRLRTKLTFLITVVIAFIALFIYVLLPMHLEEQATNAAHDKAWSIARMAAFSVAPAVLFDDRIAANEALAGVRALPDIDYVIVTKSRKKFVEYHRHPGAGPSAATFEISTPVVAGADSVGNLRLGVSLERLKVERNNDRRAAGVASLLVLLLGAIAVAGISRLMTRPLKEIANAARRIEAGDLTSRAKVRYDDEVGQLARTFNRMLDSVGRAQDQLNDLNRGLESKVVLQTGELADEAEERKLLERRIRLLLESTYDGILSLDAAGICTLANRSAGVTLGVDGPLLIARNPHTVLHGTDCRLEKCELAAVVAGEVRASVQTTFQRSSGESVDIELSSAPVIDDGKRVGSVITFHDVTERESLRRTLEDERRVTSLGQVAAMMAHEFNNVLMSIHSLVEVLNRQSEGSPQARHACELITNSIRRGKRVTEEVLRYTRPRDPVRASLNVRTWLQEFIPAMRPMLGAGIELDLELPAHDVAIVVDREQIEQVFANFITNAKHAMPAGGHITVRVAKPDGDRPVVFEVRDEGEGIPPEVLPRIFEPFFTTKHSGGTGLGLPTARQIIERHGGAITVQSSSEGTTFRVSLPAGSIPAEVVMDARPKTTQRPPLRVLLVEDDDAVSAGLRAILEINGNSVTLARSGAEFISAVHAFRPDAIVMDVGLPDCDGVDLYRSLDSSCGTIPVVFSTGHGDVVKIREVLAATHVGFLLKPYPIEDLLEKLAQVTLRAA